MATGTTARRHIMIFAMGAMALITLATTVIVGAHYWEMLSGVFLIALVGLTLPDWAAWWATYWHAKATKDGNEDKRVAVTSLLVSAAMSLVMILNAGAVLAVWWDDKQKLASETRSSESDLAKQKAKSAGNTDAIEARGRVVQQMRAAGATNATIQQYLRTEAERDKANALTTRPSTETQMATAYISQVPEAVRRYMAFWVYIVPFLCGLFGVFAIVVAVALPGGVDFGKGSNQQPQAVQPGSNSGTGIGFAPASAPATAKSGGTTTFNGNPPTNFTKPSQ